MKKTGLILGLAAALPVVAALPGFASKEKKAPFYGTNIAHRGLYTADQTIPENSIAAFKSAVEEGYGIELDVQLTSDGYVVVFHDGDLKRMCGDSREVKDVTFDELQTMRLAGTDEKIPLFSEVLRVIGGKVPLVVELKVGNRPVELSKKTYAFLKDYVGDVCIESFNPFIVAWFRFNAPELFRGLLAQRPEDYKENGVNTAGGFVLGNNLLNPICRPEFIAYKIGPQPWFVRLTQALGAMKVGWTGKSEECESGKDAIIFEHYRPKRKYK